MFGRSHTYWPREGVREGSGLTSHWTNSSVYSSDMCGAPALCPVLAGVAAEVRTGWPGRHHWEIAKAPSKAWAVGMVCGGERWQETCSKSPNERKDTWVGRGRRLSSV